MTTPQRVDFADWSHHNSGPSDLALARSHGLLGLYHKATEGATWVDPAYEHRRRQAADAGLPFGGYAFARPDGVDRDGGDAVAEAEKFLRVAKPRWGDLRPCLDLEDRVTGTGHSLSQEDLTRWVWHWVARIEREFGRHPLIYTQFPLESRFGCRLWVPRYSNTNRRPAVPAPWERESAWQFSDGDFGVPNQFPGLGHCDLSTLGDNVSMRQLKLRRHRLPSVQEFKWKGATWNVYVLTPVEKLRPVLRELKGEGVSVLHMQEAGGSDITKMLTGEGWVTYLAHDQFRMAWDPQVWGFDAKWRIGFEREWFSETGEPKFEAMAMVRLRHLGSGTYVTFGDYHTPPHVQVRNPPIRRLQSLEEIVAKWAELARDTADPLVLGGDDNLDESRRMYGNRFAFMSDARIGLTQVQAPAGTLGGGIGKPEGRRIDDFRVNDDVEVYDGAVLFGGGDHGVHVREFGCEVR